MKEKETKGKSPSPVNDVQSSVEFPGSKWIWMFMVKILFFEKHIPYKNNLLFIKIHFINYSTDYINDITKMAEFYIVFT